MSGAAASGKYLSFSTEVGDLRQRRNGWIARTAHWQSLRLQRGREALPIQARTKAGHQDRGSYLWSDQFFARSGLAKNVREGEGAFLEWEGPLENRAMVTCPPAAAPPGFNWRLTDVACISIRWAIRVWGKPVDAFLKKQVLSYGSKKSQPQTPSPV